MVETVKKEDRIIIEIEDLTTEGLGIGHAQGMAVFVKDTVIGDRVEAKILKVKKTYAYARLERLYESGACRIPARCPAARACGGCQLQMMSYPAQMAFKERRVRDALARIGGFSADDLHMEPILAMDNAGEEPWRYRNKAQFPIGKDKNGGLAAGFYAGRTHSIIPVTDCLLGCEENRRILEIVLTHMARHGIEPYHERTGTGLVRHIMTRKGFASGQIMVVLVLNGDRMPAQQELIDQLSRIPGMTAVLMNVNKDDTNVILGSRTLPLWGSTSIEDAIGPVRYRISAPSFYQVNPVQTAKLYQTALEYAGLTGQETVWDLYCGIGTITLFLAAKARRVFGVEIIPEAVQNARENAKRNGISNVEFFEGRAEEILPDYYEAHADRADVIVVDPPRKGCDRTLLETMLRMEPSRIVYVSCDPATLARDLKILCAGGYQLNKVQPCDMFPQTVHVETVVLMSRVKD